MTRVAEPDSAGLGRCLSGALELDTDPRRADLWPVLPPQWRIRPSRTAPLPWGVGWSESEIRAARAARGGRG